MVVIILEVDAQHLHDPKLKRTQCELTYTDWSYVNTNMI
jgi:hypothetical protein